MKNDQLSFALAFVCGALFLCVLALFILWLGTEPQVEENHPARWIARDWGAIIGGAVALLGAWLTIRVLRAQIEQVRTVETQREAREYAAHLRDAAAKWRLGHSNLYSLATTYYDDRASKPDRDGALLAPDIPPEIRLGRLPLVTRTLVAVALRMSVDAVRVMGRIDGIYNIMRHDLDGTLKIWDATEVMSLYAMVIVVAAANAIERVDDVSGASIVTEEDIQTAQIEMNPVTRIAAHCGEKKIVEGREGKVAEYATLTFRSSTEFDEFLKANADLV